MERTTCARARARARASTCIPWNIVRAHVRVTCVVTAWLEPNRSPYICARQTAVGTIILGARSHNALRTIVGIPLSGLEWFIHVDQLFFLTERLTDQSAARGRERPTGFHSARFFVPGPRERKRAKSITIAQSAIRNRSLAIIRLSGISIGNRTLESIGTPLAFIAIYPPGTRAYFAFR